MSDDTYNGWFNHATWAINLHITNDQRFLTEAQETVALTHADPADALHDWFLDIVDGTLHGTELAVLLLRDLLPTSRGDVDWESIASSLLPYAAGWNMPGYLPNNEPARFADVEDAKEYIIDLIDQDADEHFAVSSDSYENIGPEQVKIEREAAAAIKAVRESDYQGVTVHYGDLAYWIREA